MSGSTLPISFRMSTLSPSWTSAHSFTRFCTPSRARSDCIPRLLLRFPGCLRIGQQEYPLRVESLRGDALLVAVLNHGLDRLSIRRIPVVRVARARLLLQSAEVQATVLVL